MPGLRVSPGFGWVYPVSGYTRVSAGYTRNPGMTPGIAETRFDLKTSNTKWLIRLLFIGCGAIDVTKPSKFIWFGINSYGLMGPAF